MKTTAFIITAFLAVIVAADKPNLRSGSDVVLKRKDKNKRHSAHYVGATISIAHLLDDSDDNSKDVIINAFKEAYKTTHGDEFEIDGARIGNEISIPEDAPSEAGALLATRRSRYFFNRYFWLNINYHCRLCSDDSDYGYLPPLQILKKGSQKQHIEFEKEFCERVHNSGLLTFAHADKCTIEFTYSPLQAEEAKAFELQTATMKKGRKKQRDFDGTIGSQIMVTHVSSEDEHEILTNMNIVSEALEHAYNEIHAGSGYELTSVKLQREIDFPEDDGDGDQERGEDNSNVDILAATRGRRPRYIFSRYFWTNINYHCRLCADDSNVVPPFQILADLGAHKAFEDSFCTKLKDSGSEAYKRIGSCSIAFSYSAADNESEVAVLEQ